VNLLLRPKEARRLSVIEALVNGETTVEFASQLLGLSPRQVLRLKRRYIEKGEEGLVHGNRGRPPVHKLSQWQRQHIVHQATTLYRGASCSFLSSLLAAETPSVMVSAKTVGRVLLQAGVKNPHTHRAPRKRRSRERQPQLGLLVQVDASKHFWFEDRAGYCSLHGAIDDATSKVLALWFRPQEDLEGYLHVMRLTVQNHGVPVSLYHDRHTIFVSPQVKKLTVEDELAGRTAPRTQFGQVLEDLDILSSSAHSPQAKGRIERLWQTLQERLVIWLRIHGVKDCNTANRMLPQFLREFHDFSVTPSNEKPAFRAAPTDAKLADILSRRETRTADGGSCIHWKKKTYQLIRNERVLLLSPKTTVSVHTRLDGSVFASVKGADYELRQLTEPKPQPDPLQSRTGQPQIFRPPAASHPWRRRLLPRTSERS
jgi:transposase